jgi:MFS family permease
MLAAPFFGSLTSWGLGVMVVPMEEELGWSRSMLFAPLAVGAVIYAVLGIAVGPWLDKKDGPVVLFFSGVVLFAVSAILIRYTHSLWAYFLAFGVMGGAGRYGVQVIFAIVPKWFVRNRGISQAMIGAGFSLGPLIFPVLLQSLIDTIGWRDTWLVMGAAMLVLLAPLSLLVARMPEDLGLLPDGGPPRTAAGRTARASPRSKEPPGAATRAEALRTSQLWLLIAAIGFATLAIRGMIPNLHPFFVSEGIDATTAALSFSVYAVVAFVTVLFWGRLADRIGARVPFIIVIAIGVAALAVLAATSSRAVMFLGMAVLASGLNGFFNLWQVVLADTFGREHIGAIRGVVDAFNSTAIFVGPVLFGLLFDLSGSYGVLFGAAIVLWALSLAAALLIRPIKHAAGVRPHEV